MPIYEFYCEDCHTIFSFFSRRINTEKRPACPRCNRPELERIPSIFAISKNREESDEPDFPDIDESRLEKAMMSLAAEAEKIDENDPRQAAQLMKKLFDATGLEIGGEMEEAIKRLEAGEDPEKIEEEMGDLFDDEDIFKNLGSKKAVKRFKRKYLPPSRDETLYDL
jgi:putative FmdB family regulatory protein